MKWKAILVLAVIVFGVIAPVSIQIALVGQGHETICTADVCHSATPALFSNGTIPCMNVAQFSFLPASPIAYAEIPDHLFTLVLIPDQNEQPPKA